MMKIKKTMFGLSLCSLFLFTACQKSEDPKTSKADQQKRTPELTQNLDQNNDRELMLQAIQKNQKALQFESCAIDELDDDQKQIFVGDLNHDGKADFIYDYSIIVQCGGQGTSNLLGIFLGDGKQYKFVNTYVIGDNGLNNLIIHNIDPKGRINAELNDEKIQYIYKNKSLEELEDPNKKTIVQLGKQMASGDSPFAADLDRMTYVPNEVECGGFFSDDQPEKSTTIDHYDLHISNDQVVVMGVYGLTVKDQVQILGKTVTSMTTLAQAKALFKSLEHLDVRKNRSETIGSASEEAAKLKYDTLLSFSEKDMDGAYLLYFSHDKLIAVQYFIPC